MSTGRNTKTTLALVQIAAFARKLNALAGIQVPDAEFTEEAERGLIYSTFLQIAAN